MNCTPKTHPSTLWCGTSPYKFFANTEALPSTGAGQNAPLDSEKFAKNQEKQGENRGKEEKLGGKGKNREGSYTLPLLTDRAGYATVAKP